MFPALNVNTVRLPQLAAGPALTVPATVTLAKGTFNKINAANVVQQLAPARVNRKGWWIFNFGDGDALFWIDDTNDPVVEDCICVAPGQEYCCPPNMVTGGELKILCSVANTTYAFREGY